MTQKNPDKENGEMSEKICKERESGKNLLLAVFLVGLVVGLATVLLFGYLLGFDASLCDEEQAFYNGSCFMYGAINEMLSCSNNLSIFMDENLWNFSCINETVIKLGRYSEITYCPWYKWEDYHDPQTV